MYCERKLPVPGDVLIVLSWYHDKERNLVILGDKQGTNVFANLTPDLQLMGTSPVLVPGIKVAFHADVLLKKDDRYIVSRIATLERGEYEGRPDWLLRFSTKISVFMQELVARQEVDIIALPTVARKGITKVRARNRRPIVVR